MPFRRYHAIRCPIDYLPLDERARALTCAAGHSFDIAKQRYVNLLSAADKRSRDPGDSREMVASRRRFLDAGCYYPIARCVGDQLIARLPELRDRDAGASRRDATQWENTEGHGPLIVDAGCGEGYYLNSLHEQLRESGLSKADYLGFDISKWAMQAAARRFHASWLVASNRNIPLADNSVSALLDMFGFSNYVEFARVLRPGGLFVQVSAGKNHLKQLRDVIYAKPKSRDDVNRVAVPVGFKRLVDTRLQFFMESLEQSALQDLLSMTPHLFRASVEGKQRLSTLSELGVEADINVSVYQCAR